MRLGYEGISDFIFMEDTIEPADIILIPGGSHPELAIEAAKLFNKGFARFIIPSGGENSKLTQCKTECEYLKMVLMSEGVPEKSILEEPRARNTFDNAKLSYETICDKGLDVSKVILLCKNYHSRRAYLTYRINFPENIQIKVCPIVDGTGITKDNWMKSPERVSRVMNEVTKIGNYFEHHFIRLFCVGK